MELQKEKAVRVFACSRRRTRTGHFKIKGDIMTWLECAVWEDCGICGYLASSWKDMELHFDAAHMRMPIGDLRKCVNQYEDLRPSEHRKFVPCVKQAL